MNDNSLICRLIANNEDWQEIITSKGIEYKSSGRYTIFNYDTTKCDFFDPVVQEARGIVIDTQNLRVVCWPFRKFGNYEEPYADKIDWNSARVQTKIDGSIVKLWWDDFWHWSTNSCINADEASATDGRTFGDVIRMALEITPVYFGRLQRDYTYIFELVSPYTQVVIHYPLPELWHIGTRNNISGMESVTDIGVQRPKEYPLHTLADCVEAANNLNKDCVSIKQEGFVVVDVNWHRIKVKSPEYFIEHAARTANPAAVKREIVHNLLDKTKQELPVVEYYRYWLLELMDQIQISINSGRKIYEEMNGDRKAAAELIKKLPFSNFGFAAIDHRDLTAESALACMTEKKLLSYIPTYSKPQIRR